MELRTEDTIKNEELGILENQLKDVYHLLLVVHGIGDHTERYQYILSALIKNKDEIFNLLSTPNKNLEIDVIEWHQTLRASTIELDKKLESITLPTLDSLRGFISNNLLDFFYFLQPKFASIIYMEVVQKLNQAYANFKKKRNENDEIKVSILSHSLGTVIMYDLLVRKQINYQISDNKGNIDNWRKLVGEIGVSLELSEDIPPLDFEVNQLFNTGSPLGMILTLRNSKLYPPFVNNIYNIFHPYDPVAYRLEPLLDPTSKKDPQVLRYYKNMHGLRNHTYFKNRIKEKVGKYKGEDSQIIFDYSRIDLTLQLSGSDPRNWTSYSAASTSHSSYWTDKDLMLFIIERLYS